MSGGFHSLLPDLSDLDFFKYIGLTRSQFEEVHAIIETEIKKENSFLPPTISTREKLAICLRYFSTGSSFHDLCFNFRLGKFSIEKLVEEVSEAIWIKMQPREMPEPDETFWLEKAAEIKEKWHFPTCVSAVGGKYVVICEPIKSGSSYFNYRKTFSVVLLAAVDASYKFTVIDVSSQPQRRFSDKNIFANSNFGKRFHNNLLKLPVTEVNSWPYVLIGDEGFQLTKHLMRPYPKCKYNITNRMIFNCRLLRAHQTVKTAFGLLSTRWSVYKKPFEASLRNVHKIIKATCVLHNYLRSQVTLQQQVKEFDSIYFEDPDYQLLNLPPNNARSSNEAKQIRKAFATYFSSPEGCVRLYTRKK